MTSVAPAAPAGAATAQVALAEAALGRWVDAEAHLVEALALPADAWTRANRSAGIDLTAALETVRRHVGTLDVVCAAPGAEVWIGGRRAGAARRPRGRRPGVDPIDPGGDGVQHPAMRFVRRGFGARRAARAALLVGLLVGCSPRADGGPPLGDSGAGATRRCVDMVGNAVACALPVEGTVCPGGTATACAVVTLEEVRAATDAAGPCLRLTIANRCGQTIYSDTCIEHRDRDELEWQCWRSTTLAGAAIDVGQCNATGRYTRVSARSTGEIRVLNMQCTRP